MNLKPMKLNVQQIGQAIYQSDAAPKSLTLRQSQDLAHFVVARTLGLNALLAGKVTCVEKR